MRQKREKKYLFGNFGIEQIKKIKTQNPINKIRNKVTENRLK